MIIASAIKFKIESTNEEVVLCGVSHSDIFKQLKLLGFNPGNGYSVVEQGFVDNKNNFLNREKAYKHAVNCGQLSRREVERTKDYKILFSEYLW